MRAVVDLLIPFSLVLYVQIAKAQSPSDRVKVLPVCAQSCITGAFARCGCKILDFSCACACASFRSYSESCTDTSCSDSYLKPVLDAIEGTCSAFSSTPIALSMSSTASSASSTSRTPTTTPPASFTTTIIPTASKEEIVIPATPTVDTPSESPSTTTTQYTPSYCLPIINGTGNGWNATATCTGLYNGPVYTGIAVVFETNGWSWLSAFVFSAVYHIL